jgi:hypothetical protein
MLRVGVCNSGGVASHRDWAVVVWVASESPWALSQHRLARVSSQTAVRYREPLCLPAEVGKPRLVYPGVRLAREDASTPVAVSW